MIDFRCQVVRARAGKHSTWLAPFPVLLMATIVGLSQESAAASPGLSCDYSNNGICDAADYVVWRNALGKSITLPNDSTPGNVDQSDYIVWKSGFGDAVPGSGAMVPAMSGLATPEPTSAALFISGWLLFVLNHHRHRPIRRGSE